ncbi:MAG TPA: hypothetical protein VK856_10030 [Anaerolineaceae bacterium]|nr:hypothetical protein [Anaerolineaceae bacterium]
MNPKNLIVCPNCKSSNTIFIEDLYFALIEKDKQVLAQLKLNSDQCKSLVKHLNPPSLERLPIWAIIQPDILFSIIIVVFILLTVSSGIPLNLELFLLPIILILSYILLRNTLNKRFHAKKIERMAEIQRAQKAADYWSTLFICLNDMTVFSGHSNNYFPVEEFQEKLFV